jgi:hypothetical protein
MPSKTLTRTVKVGCFGNKLTRQILNNTEDAYKKMLKEMVEYAVRRGASQATLHRVFYAKFRAKLLEEKPIQVVEVCESGTSSRTPSGVHISFRPLVIRTAVRGASGRARPVKMRLRVGRAGDEAWERDVLGAVNTGLRYLQMGALWRWPRRGPMRCGRC